MATSACGVVSNRTARAGSMSRHASDPVIDHDLPAERTQFRRERVGDGRRAAADHRPADRVGERAEDEPERRGQRPIEREHGVRGQAAEEGPRVRVAERDAGKPRADAQRRQTEAGHRDRVAGHVDDRSEDSSAISSTSRTSGPNSAPRGRPSRPSPTAVASTERSRTTARSAIERVRERRVRVDELDAAGRPVDGAHERRGQLSDTIVEHTSWWNPGRVSSSVRVPPPIVDSAS